MHLRDLHLISMFKIVHIISNFSDPISTGYIITEPLVGIRIQQLNSDNTLKTTSNVSDSVTLICGGIGMNSGDSTLTYKWESSGSTGSTTRFHVISSVAKSDAKTYKCTVTNSGGTSSSKELTLTVGGMSPLCMLFIHPYSG